MTEPVYVGISHDQLMTWQGRLIVALTAEERTALAGTLVELPQYHVSVTDWLADQGLTADGRRTDPAAHEVPKPGSRWVWEIDKPHAVCLLEVADVTWNGEEWWVTTRAILANHTCWCGNRGGLFRNSLDRFREAATPVGSVRGEWERRSG